MPFEPLQTDEPLSGPVPRKKDFEAQLMAGCTTIGVVSILTYALTAWPFAVLPEYTWWGLGTILVVGPLAAAAFGIVVSLKLGLAGATGFFGGAMAGAVFMYLRLQQTILAQYTRDLPKPEYPDAVAYALPAGWFLIAAALAWLFCRKERPAP